MKVKIISAQKMTLKNGDVLNRFFAILPDNAVGNFYSSYNFAVGDEVTLSIGIDKECKFVVRPVIPNR